MTSDQRKGYWLGFLGVVLFSLNFPAMKVAVAELDPTLVGFGRSFLAAIPAALMLLFLRPPLPRRGQLAPLLLVAGGAVIGFPVLLALALHRVPSSHAAIVTALMPLATAMLGSWRDRERQPPLFWGMALAGSALVVAYALFTGAGAITGPDFLLFLAVAAGAIGYCEGARLAREIGSWQVLCWALVISVPVLAYPIGRSLFLHGAHASVAAWGGFLYAGFIAMFLGYIAWYRGLVLGGIARVSQIQLVLPFLALGFSACLLGERLTFPAIACALLVSGCVLVTRRLGPVGSVEPVGPGTVRGNRLVIQVESRGGVRYVPPPYEHD